MEKRRKRIDDNWVRCPYCRHKMFKQFMSNGYVLIEIKCSSCKRIFELLVGEDMDLDNR